ncbi:hypothetical protein RIEGSTA812A_PEG_630 [invertebrate metagenome]|uniref:Uncharacterized protein n=1 Tax=invertebrate metagenome TaxID=1711999 RepID=A0A484H5B3_9ZZZZ
MPPLLPWNHRSQNLYARTSAFIQSALADPAMAVRAKQVSAGLIAYFVHVLDFESWCVFRVALGPEGLRNVSEKVLQWRNVALSEEEDLAAWGYEIIAINLAATAAATAPDAAAAARLTDSILQRALAEASESS